MVQVMLTWILAQWEEYHTSLMLYGNSFYGVLECNYTLALVHVLTFFAGPEFWRSPVTDYLPVKQLKGWREWPASLSEKQSTAQHLPAL
jgi:ethanolaminephosphotransferase